MYRHYVLCRANQPSAAMEPSKSTLLGHCTMTVWAWHRNNHLRLPHHPDWIVHNLSSFLGVWPLQVLTSPSHTQLYLTASRVRGASLHRTSPFSNLLPQTHKHKRFLSIELLFYPNNCLKIGVHKWPPAVDLPGLLIHLVKFVQIPKYLEHCRLTKAKEDAETFFFFFILNSLQPKEKTNQFVWNSLFSIAKGRLSFWLLLPHFKF